MTTVFHLSCEGRRRHFQMCSWINQDMNFVFFENFLFAHRFDTLNNIDTGYIHWTLNNLSETSFELWDYVDHNKWCTILPNFRHHTLDMNQTVDRLVLWVLCNPYLSGLIAVRPRLMHICNIEFRGRCSGVKRATFLKLLSNRTSFVIFA